MRYFLKKLRKFESWIGGLWSCVFVVNGQKINFGSWKVLISIPSHLAIGFLWSLALTLITGSMITGAISGGLSSAILLEGKDVYKYIAKEDYTMFYQSGVDSIFYMIGALIFFLMR